MCNFCQDPELDGFKYFDDIEAKIKIKSDEPIEGSNGKRIKMGLSLPVTVSGCIWSPGKTFSFYIVDGLENPLLEDIDLDFPIKFCPMCGRELDEMED